LFETTLFVNACGLTAGLKAAESAALPQGKEMNTQPAIDPQVLSDANDAMKVTKITMMMKEDTVFYTTILFNLTQELTTELPTAAVDGKRLWINPVFFNSLTPEQRIGLIAHEVLHVALDHMHRCGYRNHELWNVAGDYVINAALKKAKYGLPPGGLYDSKYEGMATEQVYTILEKKSKEEQQNLIGKMKSGMGGDVKYPKDAAPGQEVTQEEVTEIILQASTMSKMMGDKAGSTPNEIDVHLQRTINPPLPWNVILQNYMTEFQKDDYTMRRPNRRFMPAHYLPTAHSEAICNIAVAVDISSSVSDPQFNAMITRVDDIMQMMGPKKITVISFNTEIQDIQELTEGQNAFKHLKFKGRGGTSIKEVLKWVDENKPTVTIVFTDGEFNQNYPAPKGSPMIWLIHENPKWQSQLGGRVIHHEINEAQ
jgi:predicted metal-dependent peptidase